MNGRPILCLDFDGVLHSYTSGWIEVDFIPDPPVPGAFEFLVKTLDEFNTMIYGSRSNSKEGIHAMQIWLAYWAQRELKNKEEVNKIIIHFRDSQAWPTQKPPAFVSIDDRAITFTGLWPSIEELKAFNPLNNQ